MSSKVMKREKYFDTLKYFSILLVMLIHFFSFFDHPLVDFWSNFPYNLFLFGLGGKLGVSIFAVITGYFACRSGKKQDPIYYIVKRYIYFVIADFFISTIYYLTNINGVRSENNFFLVIGQSLMLGDLVAGEFWFARAFFMGSIMSFFLGKYDVKIPILSVIVLALVSLDMQYTATYAANCILGCIVDRLFEKDYDFLHNAKFHVIIFALVYILVKRNNSNISYFIWGICGVMLILLAKYNPVFNQLCNSSLLSYMGQKTMSILMIHIPCLYLVDNLLRIKENNGSLLLAGIIWFMIVHLLAVPLDCLLNLVLNQVYSVYGFLYAGIMKVLNRNNRGEKDA